MTVEVMTIGQVVPLTLQELAAIAARAALAEQASRPMGPTAWHVLVTQPQHERIAASSLIARGMTAYLPILLERRTTQRKVVETEYARISGARGGNVVVAAMLPLFPGYLFVELPRDGSRHRRARDTAGVAEFLRVEGVAPMMPAAAIALLRSREWALLEEQKGAFDLTRGRNGDLVPPSRRNGAAFGRFKPGQEVSFLADSVHGAFAGLFATIDTLDENGRIGVLLALFGRQTRVTCDPSELEAIGP